MQGLRAGVRAGWGRWAGGRLAGVPSAANVEGAEGKDRLAERASEQGRSTALAALGLGWSSARAGGPAGRRTQKRRRHSLAAGRVREGPRGRQGPGTPKEVIEVIALTGGRQRMRRGSSQA